MSTTFKVRRELQSAVTVLERHGRVVIVGGPKSGKTFLGHELLRHFSNRFTTHNIYSTRKLKKHLEEGRQHILLMDGTLGEVGVDMDEYKVWRALLPRLMTCTDVRQCLVVVTCYPHVLLELQALEEGSHSFLLQDTCTVSLKEMAEDERKEMLHHFLCDVTMTQQEKHALVERVLKDDMSGATFPWCCARLVQRLHNSPLDDPSDVFTSPAESYVTLVHRMLMDPTHGETVAALLCLTMMGLSDFYGNQHNTHTALRELGFRQCSADCLEKNASFLRGFILSENSSTFFSRVLYDAVGVALGRSHRLPVLLKICDMDFLVKYVSVWVQPSDLHLNIPSNVTSNVHLLERILTDITKGKLIEISQYLSLQSELFLEKLKHHSRNRKSGEIQITRAMDTLHGLPLLYWSVWTGCDWLVNWCLDISIKDGEAPPNILQSAFVWALLNRTECSETFKMNNCTILQSVNKFLSEYNDRVSMTTLPFPKKELLFSEGSKSLYDHITSCDNLFYLGNPSLLIPPSVLTMVRKEDSFHIQFNGKQVYLTLRLLSDTQVNQVDNEGNTLLHIAAASGDENVIDVVVRSGASLTAKNNSNFTPLQVAHRCDAVENTNRCSSELQNIHKACENGDIVAVKILLCCGVSVEDKDNENGTPLHAACKEGHTDLVRLLLELGADVNSKHRYGFTALHLACDKGHEDIVSILVKYGADICATDDMSHTPLHYACLQDNKQCVFLLVDNGADISITSVLMETPLHFACYKGITDVITLLLDRGADVNAISKNGRTPLYCACTVENTETDAVAVLIDRGADVNVKCIHDMTALHYACCVGNTNVAALLLDLGTEINLKSVFGETPLIWACQFRNANIDVIALLLNRGADINSKNTDGETALHFACRSQEKDIVVLLLNHGADINVKSRIGQTPLSYACSSIKTDVVACLLECGAEVNVVSMNGETPLLCACMRADKETVALLLDHGADVNAKSDTGETPLISICRLGKTDHVALLLDRGADINAVSVCGDTPLRSACQLRDTESLDLLLSHGADVNTKFIDGQTPLFYACHPRMADCVSKLLDLGADVNALSPNDQTPLHIACLYDNRKIASLLLDRGADIHAKSCDQETPIHIACQYQRKHCLALFLHKGLDVNAKYSSGETLLHWACQWGNIDAAGVLLDHGANINAKSEYGMTPLHNACQCENIDTAIWLLDHGADVNAKCVNGMTPLHHAYQYKSGDFAALLIDRGANIGAKLTY